MPETEDESTGSASVTATVSGTEDEIPSTEGLTSPQAHSIYILSKVFRALLYSMNLPANDVEDAVARIKERKMGRLFENVTMDIQAERRNAIEARTELNAARKELETVWRLYLF